MTQISLGTSTMLTNLAGTHAQLGMHKIVLLGFNAIATFCVVVMATTLIQSKQCVADGPLNKERGSRKLPNTNHMR